MHLSVRAGNSTSFLHSIGSGVRAAVFTAPCLRVYAMFPACDKGLFSSAVGMPLQPPLGNLNADQNKLSNFHLHRLDGYASLLKLGVEDLRLPFR